MADRQSNQIFSCSLNSACVTEPPSTHVQGLGNRRVRVHRELAWIKRAILPA
jgi:hypothetical protein